eukprot:3884305-Amphidinium_carterae.3
MAETLVEHTIRGFDKTDDFRRRVTGLSYGRLAYSEGYAIDVVLRPVFGTRTVPRGVQYESCLDCPRTKWLTGKGGHAGTPDGWIRQGDKPRYEVRFTNNYQSHVGLKDLDITIIAYRMLQGHFSRIG